MIHSEGFLAIVNQCRPAIKECTILDIKKMLDRSEKFHLVDVREDREFEIDRIPSALHLSKGIIERDIEITFPDKQTTLYLYCGGGFRSILAAYNLKLMGYTNIISIDGGIRAWREAGYALETEKT